MATQPQPQPRRMEPAQEYPQAQPSGWVGWIAFAGIMMVMAGVWWLFAGLVALLNSDFFVVTQDYVVRFNATTWGWIHLVVGTVVLFAGIGLFSGATWARVVGIIVAALAGLAAFAWLPYFPIWAIIFITISVAVIWALTAHGREITMVP